MYGRLPQIPGAQVRHSFMSFPHTPWAIRSPGCAPQKTSETPKSVIFRWPSSVMSKFSSLISLCAIPWLWRYATPRINCLKRQRLSSKDRYRFCTRVKISPWAQYSITWFQRPFCVHNRTLSTILGWWQLLAMLYSDLTFFTYSSSSSFWPFFRNSFTANTCSQGAPFRTMSFTVAVAPFPINLPLRPGKRLPLANSSLSSTVSTSKSSGRVALILLDFKPVPVAAGLEIKWSGSIRAIWLMLLVRLLSGRFGVLEKEIFGFLRLKPVNDLPDFLFSGGPSCWFSQLSSVLVEDAGDEHEFACDVAAEFSRDLVNEGLRGGWIHEVDIEQSEPAGVRSGGRWSTPCEFDRRNRFLNFWPVPDRLGGGGLEEGVDSGAAWRLGVVAEEFNEGGVAGVLRMTGLWGVDGAKSVPLLAKLSWWPKGEVCVSLVGVKVSVSSLHVSSSSSSGIASWGSMLLPSEVGVIKKFEDRGTKFCTCGCGVVIFKASTFRINGVVSMAMARLTDGIVGYQDEERLLSLGISRSNIATRPSTTGEC